MKKIFTSRQTKGEYHALISEMRLGDQESTVSHSSILEMQGDIVMAEFSVT